MRESAVPSIPAASQKILRSLKEIVNGVPDNEIYAALKDCNMDPNEAVNKLLSQDPFCQVKSKRDKRKETKENTEVRSRGGSGTSNRGRLGANHDVGRRMSTKTSSIDFGLKRGNPAYKKDYGNNAIPDSQSSSTSTANNINCSAPTESKLCTTGMSDGIISSKPSQGVQPSWVGTRVGVSMADIVKMGRPHTKTPTIPSTASSHSSHSAAISNLGLQNVEDNFPPITSSCELHRSIHSSHVPAAKFPDEQRSVNQGISSNSGPLGQQLPDASGPSLCETFAASVTNMDPSSDFCDDEDKSHSDSGTDAVQVTEDVVAVQNQELDPAPGADRHIQVNNTGCLIFAEDGSIKSSYQFQSPGFERREGSSHPCIPDYLRASSVQDAHEAVTSAVTGLQHLSLQKEEGNAPAVRENRAVIIPNHLQVPTTDCSHLSFGSFSSGISASFTGSFASNTLKSTLDDATGAANDSSVEHLDTRSTADYGNEQVSASNENLGSTSPTQPVIRSHDTTVEATNGHQYPFPSSLANYAIGSSSQTNATGSSSDINSQLQNPVPLSSVITSTNPSPSDFLASAVQPARDTDFPYSPFTILQSTSMRYESGMSSITGPIVSVPEIMKPNAFSCQSNPQTLPSTSIPMATALPQHLAMHHFSQPPLFANVVPYSFLQNCAFMPSAFQQPYAASTVYHQSPARAQSTGMKYSLAQYKNSIPASSLPQAPAVASVYGNIGSSTNIPGSFLLNPSTAPSSTKIGYSDAIGSQFKDTSNYGSQQNEASTLWVNGPGSRTMSVLPASTYYAYQAQNQQSAMRQSQQLPHYETRGYPNFYHSQALGSQECQQLSDGTTNASRGTPSQQSHQIWQQSY